MSAELTVFSFYKFLESKLAFSELADIAEALTANARELEILGLLILAPEGINGTLSADGSSLNDFAKKLSARFGRLEFKESHASKHPFSKFSVKIRDEIVTSGIAGVTSHEGHVTPEEWHRVLGASDPERVRPVVLDVRNSYESKIGKFQGAIPVQTENFTEFVSAFQRIGIAKEQQIYTYCTGGVRCEKAAIALKSLGYKSVCQLSGGILAYLASYPTGLFKGECFVFDNRVAVDANLKPTENYSFCSRCGQPAIRRIDGDGAVCDGCQTARAGKELASNFEANLEGAINDEG